MSTLLTACLTPSDGPSQFGEVRVRPAFTTGEEPESVRVNVDSIRTTIRRAGSVDDPLVERVMPYSAAEARAWVLELRSVSDNVGVDLELLAAGAVVYRGERELTVTQGSIGRAPAEDVPVVYVGPISAHRVQVEPARVVFGGIGSQRQMLATVYDRKDNVLAGKTVQWSSRDASVAQIDANGLLTSIGSGVATITAAVDGVQDSSVVLVETTLARTTSIDSDSSALVADGAASSRVTVTVRDAHGDTVGASAGTVTLATTLGTLGTVTDHQDGTYSATLTSDVVPGQAIVTGTLNGAAISDSAFIRFVEQGGGSGGTRHRTTIKADSASLVADGSASTNVTVSVLDSVGNLLGSSAGTVLLATQLGTLSTVTDHHDGRYTATLTAGTSTGNTVITGTLNGAAIADSAVVALVAGQGSVATTTITADSASLTADGISTSMITVVVRDGHGNPVGASAGVVLLSASMGTIGIVTDHQDGTYTATFTAGTVSGDAVVTGTLDATAIGDSAVIVLRTSAPSALTSTIDADSSSLVANGMATSLVTVVVRDRNGNVVPTTTSVVTLATTLGTLSAVTNNFNGYFVATLTADTVTGTALITGTLNGNPIRDSALVQFVPVPGSPSRTTIAADSLSLEANDSSTTLVTVEVLDANGKRVPSSAGTVLLVTTLGRLSPVTDHNDGTYTAVLQVGTVAGNAVVSGTLNGIAIGDSAVVQFVPGPGSATQTTITADSASLEANDSSTTLVTVEVKDANGNRVGSSAGTVLLVTTLGTLGPVTDHNDGSYTAVLKAGTIAGNAIVSGSLNGIAIGDSARVQLRPGTADPTKTTIVADSASFEANGASTSQITVAVLDAYGNLVGASAGPVTLATTYGALSSVTDHQDGTYTAVLTAALVPGVAVITGTLNGNPLTDSATVQAYARTASIRTTTISTDSAAMVLGSTTIVTVAVRDSAGVPIGASAGTVTLSTTMGQLSSVTDHGDGTYTALLTVLSASQDLAVVTGTLNGTPIADSAVVRIRGQSRSSLQPSQPELNIGTASFEFPSQTSTTLEPGLPARPVVLNPISR